MANENTISPSSFSSNVCSSYVGYRWFDLVRTQKWAERASTYRIAGSGYTDKDLQTFTRDIPAGYYIRPIPQGQLDGLIMSKEEKAAYQNPAYRQ